MPHKLARAVEQLNMAGSDPCVWSARYMISNTDLGASRSSAIWARGPSLENALVQNILSGHTLTLNPSALALVRRAGRQKVSHHDWWIYLVMMACDARALVDPEIVLHYRQHNANVMGGRSSAQAQRKRLSALLKGDMRRLINENLLALGNVEGFPLTEPARELMKRWQDSQQREKIGLLMEFNIHRQSRMETALLYLAAAIGRL